MFFFGAKGPKNKKTHPTWITMEFLRFPRWIHLDSGYVLHALWPQWGCLLRGDGCWWRWSGSHQKWRPKSCRRQVWYRLLWCTVPSWYEIYGGKGKCLLAVAGFFFREWYKFEVFITGSYAMCFFTVETLALELVKLVRSLFLRCGCFCCCVCCSGGGVDPINKGHRLEREPWSPHWQIWLLLCRDGHLGSKLPGNSLYAIGLMRFVFCFLFLSPFFLSRFKKNIFQPDWN